MESPLWLDSLALADPTYILPVLTSAIMPGCLVLVRKSSAGIKDTIQQLPSERWTRMNTIWMTLNHFIQKLNLDVSIDQSEPSTCRVRPGDRRELQGCLCGSQSSQSRLTNQELFGSVDTEAAPTESTESSTGGPSTMQKYSKYFSRGSALFFIPFTSGFPSGANQNNQNSFQVRFFVRSNCQPWVLISLDPQNVNLGLRTFGESSRDSDASSRQPIFQ